jgi:hypothetical protein
MDRSLQAVGSLPAIVVARQVCEAAKPAPAAKKSALVRREAGREIRKIGRICEGNARAVRRRAASILLCTLTVGALGDLYHNVLLITVNFRYFFEASVLTHLTSLI